jgi:uncharacterized protein (DUF433 family)
MFLRRLEALTFNTNYLEKPRNLGRFGYFEVLENKARGHIQIDPQICHGQPVIKGTRILVSQLLSALSSGESHESLLKNYPSLKPSDIEAALAFGSDLARFEEIPEAAAR